ncbi:MAG TPA: hypothetical protein DGG95_02465 [Cytophagales bacterium]|jgi:uncharacterized protein|nr:hypothetical protein [Cytophagales bacterium]
MAQPQIIYSQLLLHYPAKAIFLCILIFISERSVAQNDSVAIADVKKFQTELNEQFRSKKESPLEPKDFKQFKAHDFFPIDLKYRVTAKFKRTLNEPVFEMRTTIPRQNPHRVFGIITFSIDDKEFQLPVYQSLNLMAKEEYKDYLFLPFTDLTNGEETYDGGRYIDLKIPSVDEIVVDFNKAYNPYCAYSHRYSCPIVPSQNHLEAKVLAGVKYLKKPSH